MHRAAAPGEIRGFPDGHAPGPWAASWHDDRILVRCVCGGLADHTGIDTVLWRAGFVGLTVADGAGVLVYVLLWVLVPPAPLRDDEMPSPVEELGRRVHAALSGTRPLPAR